MPTPFNLEHAIATWRRPFEHNRTFSADDLDELESSLRDRVDGFTDAGMSEEDAFREAVRRMGSHAAAEAEYRKVYWGKLKRRRLLLSELQSRFDMFANYLKVALRSLLRQKGYSFINVVGLTLGLACCLLLFQYVAFEYSFDRFNEHAEHIYRVNTRVVQDGDAPATASVSGWAMGPALAESVPDVLRYVRLHPDYDRAVVVNPAQPDQVYEEEGVFYADPTFFEMFSYPLVHGTPGQVLTQPGTVAVSESLARKYFGAADPVGQTLEVTGWIDGAYRVTGVFEDVPPHSHLQFDLLLPMADLLERSQFSEPDTGWGWTNFLTYVQLHENADPAAVAPKLTDVLLRYRGEEFEARGKQASLQAQPLLDIHLDDSVTAPQTVSSSRRTVYFFTLIGLITLFIALINYVNLSTARAMSRAREVGVRKAVGAGRGQLVWQFLSESALTNGVAFLLAIALAVALRPVINQLADASLTAAVWTEPAFWAVVVGVFVAATLLAGLYPAFVLSSFHPATVLKGKPGSLASRAWLRRGLVVFQFGASIVLLVGTLVVYHQLDHMRSLDLGIDLERIVTVPAPRILPEGASRVAAMETFEQEVARLPAVRQIATSSTLPGRGFSMNTNNVRRMTADPSDEVTGFITWIDRDFVDLYGLTLLAGDGLDRITLPTPKGEPSPVLITETAARAVGFDAPGDAVGEEIYVSGPRRVVGVLKDFNWSSAHSSYQNVILWLAEGQPHISIKVTTQDLPQTLAGIERIYRQQFAGNPFQYTFADAAFDQQYRNDQRFATLFSGFAGLALVIACLGLFGLASFTAQQRKKEIGVRKVLGASVGGLMGLLLKDFLKLVGLAFLVAAPLAYLLMQRWLQDFAYRIDLGVGVFLTAGLAVLIIALLTVSYQSLRSALADPVANLRYE